MPPVKGCIDHPPGVLQRSPKTTRPRKEKIEELKEDGKKEMDQDRLFNPYTDTRVLYGELNREVKRILVWGGHGSGRSSAGRSFGGKGQKD